MPGDGLGTEVRSGGTDAFHPRHVIGQPAQIDQLLVKQDVYEGEQQYAVGAGAHGDVSVGHLGGAGPVRIQHDQPAAAPTQRLESASEIGRGRQAPVGHQRVGADDDEVVGAIEIGNRECQGVAVQIAAGDVFGHLIQRAGREDRPGAQGTDDGGAVERTGDGVGIRIAHVDPDRGPAGGGDHPAQSCGDGGEGLRPSGFDEFAVVADHRVGQSVGVVVEFGEAGPLRADVSVAEHVVAVPACTADPVVVDAQHQSAGGFTQGTDAQGGTAHRNHSAAPSPAKQEVWAYGRGNRQSRNSSYWAGSLLCFPRLK